MTENINKNLFDEIKQLKESTKSLISQMMAQNDIIINLRQEVDILKHCKSSEEKATSEDEPKILSKGFEPNDLLSTPLSVDIDALHPPQVLTIEGFVPHDAIQFSLALQNAQSENIMLHINPRYNTGFVQDEAVVRTDFKTGFGWGPEETFGGNPFPAGQPFKLNIECTSDCFMIRVNNKFWNSFAHRQDYSLVNKIHIKGQVNISGYSVISKEQ